MKSFLMKLYRFSQAHRKGSPTVEFVLIIPFFIMMALVVWQLAVAGLAVMDTQAAIRDAVRTAALTKDEDETRKRAYASFGESGAYRIKDIDIDIGKENAEVKIKTEIDLLFFNSSTNIEIEDKAEAPIVDKIIY